MSDVNGQNGANKRKSSARDALPRKVLKRNQAKPVERKVVQFWDKDQRPPMTPDEVKRNFLHALRRANLLRDYDLLYKYALIQPDEIRLLFINPAPSYDKELFVFMETFKDSETGSGRQEYEALSYHWGPGPADKPVYLYNHEPRPKITFRELVESQSRSDEKKEKFSLSQVLPDYTKGGRFYVRPNLDKALRYLRHKTETVILWVDAVCINQSDEKVEKPAQIAKMKPSTIKHLIKEEFQAAMDFSQKIIQLTKLEASLQDINATKSWSDLLDLMRCSWFSRRWVIQELALAREATVHCGEKCVPWQEFADAIGLFALNFERIRALFRQSQDDKIYQNYTNFGELAPLGAKVLVDAITNTFRKNADDTYFEPVFNLEILVSNLCTFESSDPRDTIYALLNIAKESLLPPKLGGHSVKPPAPNYEKDILEVYTDFLEWVVSETQSLDVLCRQWAIPERTKPGGRKNPTPLITLPSWIQTITKSPWGFQEQAFNGRINGDSVVGKAGRRRYNASHWKKPEVRFGQRWALIPADGLSLSRTNSAPPILRNLITSPLTVVGPSGIKSKISPAHRLFVKGLDIGTITWSSDPVSRGVITKKCLEKGGWQNQGKDLAKVPDKLWRTLVADRNAEGENPPPWYHRAALHSMALADNNGDLATHELLNRGTTQNNNLPPIVTEYLRRVQAVSWNRKFIEAEPQAGTLSMPVERQNLHFGLGPPDTEIGDRICILFGCSVPCILRPSKEGGGKYYTFVGEAYVYGRMDGEAVAGLTDSDLKQMTKDFTII